MNEQRYQADLKITVEDFASSGWKEVISNIAKQDYSAMWISFSDAARNAIELGRNKQGKVLWLLGDACSMMLSPSSWNEPFKAFGITSGRRSTIPDDFSASDIQFFEDILDLVADNRLKARLADLVWLKKTPRSHLFAIKAIDAYQSIPLDMEHLIRGGAGFLGASNCLGYEASRYCRR